MFIKIGDKDYEKVENLKFDPTADVTGTTVEINQFSATIQTTDTIRFGEYAELFDNEANLWADYWVTEAEVVSDNKRNIVAQSLILLLDRFKLPAKMYENAPASQVIDDIFSKAPKAKYELVSPKEAEYPTITGFCPEQTGRDRLQWVCFVIGAYIKTFFSEKIEILPVDETLKTLQMDEVFYRPTVNYEDFVTAIKVRAYSYTKGTPTSTDEYVTEDEASKVYYIQTYSDTVTENKDSPETASENVVEITDCTLVNASNVDSIISRLSGRYFISHSDDGTPSRPTQVQFDAIDRGKYLPADRISVPIDTGGRNAAQGFITSCSFSFGNAQKAQISLQRIELAELVKVEIIYFGRMSEDMRTKVGQEVRFFPANTTQKVEAKYFDRRYADIMGGAKQKDIRYIFRPDDEYVTINVGATDSSLGQDESIALQCESYSELLGTKKYQLTISSVDGMNFDDDGYTIITKDSTGTETETKMGSLELN